MPKKRKKTEEENASNSRLVNLERSMRLTGCRFSESSTKQYQKPQSAFEYDFHGKTVRGDRSNMIIYFLKTCSISMYLSTD